MMSPSEPATSDETPPIRPKVALVLPGGGARAAYQVGVLRALGRRFENYFFPIITGVSAGAINATYLAAASGSLYRASEDLAKLWGEITFEDVFRVDTRWLMGNAARWLTRLGGGGRLGRKARGLLDTEPLRQLLRRSLGDTDGPIEGIAANLERGRLQAAALLTVNYGTGQTVSWIEGSDIDPWERPERRARQTRLTVEHVMASAALHLLFPAVDLGDGWYGDGGIRLSAPLSPALHLGAERLLAISPRYDRSQREANHPTIRHYPPPAQIAGNLLNAVFLDVLDQDIERLERLNSLVRKLPEDERDDLKPIDVLHLRPSQDLGRLSAGFEPRLPGAFKMFTRSLGTQETESPDALSLLMFQPDYIAKLIELGEDDAEAQMGAIETLLGQ